MTSSFRIDIKNLSKIYPRQLTDQLASVASAALGKSSDNFRGGAALDDLTLSISQGERLGVIGRNGAGKSTLLSILAGVSDPTSGTLNIDGHVTAVLTLGSGLREELSGRENIYLDGETQGKTRAEVEDDVNEIIAFSDLGEFIDMPLHTYSTGMKARLAFAIITQIEPEILIIDEALSVGDAAFAVKAEQRIKNLCNSGAIVLIVSHSMQSIRDLCDRCLWLDDGKLVMDGPADDVTYAYQEAIRQEDEASHMARFKSIVGVKSHCSEYKLGTLDMYSAGEKCVSAESMTSLTVVCEYKIPRDAAERIVGVLRCVRLDGALIFENEVQFSKVGSSEIVANYPCLNLASGIYCMTLEMANPESGDVFAETSNVLEIYAKEETKGGRPAIVKVGQIKSKKIEEVSQQI